MCFSILLPIFHIFLIKLKGHLNLAPKQYSNPCFRELSPEESLGPREFSDESDVEVETSDGRQSAESEEKIVRKFPKLVF